MVHGLHTTDGDSDAHILVFDTEALIVQLLCEEFGIPSIDGSEDQSSQQRRGEVEQRITGLAHYCRRVQESLASPLSHIIVL